MRRTGIDLSPTRCTVIDASLMRRRQTHGERSSLRVYSFASTGRVNDTRALTAELRPLAAGGAFSRHAWVTLWDVRSSHRYIRVAPDRLKDAETIAVQHGASVLAVDATRITVGVAKGVRPADPQQRIELSFFAASSDDIAARLRPVQNAGFIVDGVCTPCGALWAQARLRRPSLPAAVHTYVAIGASFSALVIVSNGFLLYAKEMRWGFTNPQVTPSPVPTRDAVAGRLAQELRQSFLYLKQYWEEDVSQVLLCGDMPEIRSLTAPLIERLNVEVETLDVLDGIDATVLSKPADQFTDHVASMRLASAVAAAPPPVNLLPLEIRLDRAARVGQWVCAAGVAAVVALGAFLYAWEGVRMDHARQSAAVLQQQIAALQSDARAADARRAAAAGSSSAGTQIAGILDTIERSMTPDDTIRSVRILPEASGWRVAVRTAHRVGPETAVEYSVPR